MTPLNAVSHLRSFLARQGNRSLLIFIIIADLVVFLGGIPLERYSLGVAADRTSSSLLIIELLAANGVLLVILCCAIVSSSLFINRALVKRFIRKPSHVTVERGEIESPVYSSSADRS